MLKGTAADLYGWRHGLSAAEPRDGARSGTGTIQLNWRRDYGGIAHTVKIAMGIGGACHRGWWRHDLSLQLTRAVSSAGLANVARDLYRWRRDDCGCWKCESRMRIGGLLRRRHRRRNHGDSLCSWHPEGRDIARRRAGAGWDDRGIHAGQGAHLFPLSLRRRRDNIGA